MFDWGIGGLEALFGWVGDAAGAVVGWAWDKVTTGIYRWLANGLALMIEWVWSVLDSATTPHVTAGWFRNDLAVRVGLIALAATIGMMMLSAAQAALAGRPEQILDAVKEGIKSIAASAFTLTVLDVLIGVTDEASLMIWQSGRPDLVKMIEGMVAVATVTGPLSTTFVGPLVLLFGFLGLIGLVVSLMMRSTLIYVVAAIAPIVWSLGVLPSFRGSSRKLIHLGVSLVLSKLAIVITMVVAVKLIAHPSGDQNSTSVINDAAAAVGTLMSGFICFLLAAVTPIVLYRLMPVVEGAMVGSGVAGGWARGATSMASTALMVKSLGASKAASAATRGVSGQAGVAGAAGGATSAAGGGPSGGSPGQSSPAGQPVGGTVSSSPGSMNSVPAFAPDNTSTAPASPTEGNAGSSTPTRPVAEPSSSSSSSSSPSPTAEQQPTRPTVASPSEPGPES